MIWKLDDGQARTPGAASVPLHKGEMLRLERTDQTQTTALVARDTQWSVVVTK
jgi:hypothetical protein